MKSNQILTTQAAATDTTASQHIHPANALLPPVDICETSEGITLTADLPGVSKEHLTIHIDRNLLRIEADVELDMPDGMNAIHADVHSTRFVREFTLSGELDTETVEANLKDGVLSLRIPRREELRPRKIQIHGD